MCRNHLKTSRKVRDTKEAITAFMGSRLRLSHDCRNSPRREIKPEPQIRFPNTELQSCDPPAYSSEKLWGFCPLEKKGAHWRQSCLFIFPFLYFFFLFTFMITPPYILLKNFYFIFRQRRREGERKGGKPQCVVASHTPPLGTWTATQACALNCELNQ